MTRRQQRWLIIGAMSAAALIFALFKAVPIGLRMYAYSSLDQATLAVPVVAVPCADRRDSTEGTLIDLGYAEFRLPGDVELVTVARHETTGEAWAILLKGDGFALAVLRARTYEPYVPVVRLNADSPIAPIGWSEWAAPSESSDQYRSEYLSGTVAKAGSLIDLYGTFEYSMLQWHIRPLTTMEIAGTSTDQFTRYVSVAIAKIQFRNAGTQTLLLNREGVRALAPNYGRLWDLRVWPDGTSFYQGIAVRNVVHDADAERVCQEIVSTFRVKADPTASQAELWAMFHEACEGK